MKGLVRRDTVLVLESVVAFLQEEVEESLKFYSSEDSSEEDSGDSAERVKVKKKETPEKPYVMDPDLRMLLKNTKPLLQSRNSAVFYSCWGLLNNCVGSSKARNRKL